MKALKIFGAVLGLLIVAIGVIFAIGFPAGLITGMVEERFEKETGYRLDINGGATIKLWPQTVVSLSDVALFDPQDRDITERVRVENIRAELSLRGLLTGDPRVREIRIDRPTITLPMSRERTRQLSRQRSTANLDDVPMIIDRVVVSDATFIFRDTRHRVESRIDKFNLTATMPEGRKVDVTVDARSGDQTFKLEAKATIPTGPVDGMIVPVDFKIDAPGMLPQPLTGNSEVKVAGTNISINSLTGTFGTAQFSGYAAIEASAKPLVKVNLDFKQLDLERPAALDKPSAPAQGWSDEPIKLDGLNYVDMDFQISTAVLNVGTLQLAPAKLEGALASGILKMTVSQVGLYKGLAGIGLAVDASVASPVMAVRAELADVRALPLFTAAADFTRLDGRMWAQFDIRTSGNSQREMVANLSGTTNFDFRDGQIRGINVAQMIRNLTASTLSGWQEDEVQATDLSELHASFRIEKGKAETSDLRVAGPLVRITGAGTADLPTKSVSFRLEPKLVMTIQGQGSSVTDPVGLGVPVIMEGPWTAPRIYPDMAGILENPDAAFGKLRELGQGLFGPNFLGGNQGSQPGQPAQGGTGNKLIEGIGSLIQQGLGGNTKPQGSAPPSQGQAPQAQAPQSTQPGQQQPAQPAQPSQTPQSPQNQQLDSIIRQLFGR